MSETPTAAPSLDTLAPVSRFVLALTQNAILADLWRRGFPADAAETTRLRHEWRRAVSELGPAEARRRLLVFAQTWVRDTGLCPFCAAPAHEGGVLTCPTLPERGGRDA